MTPLREYRYTPQEVGLDAFPPGELRLEGTVQVTDPDEADIFVCPCAMFVFQKNSTELDPDLFKRFKHFAGNECRHVLFDVSDWASVFYGIGAIMLRCNLQKEMLDVDPNSMCIPWPVDDYADCIEMPAGGFVYDVGFQGWNSRATRELSAKSCLNSSLKCDIAMYSDFTGYCWDTSEGLRRRAEFRRSMRESRLQLCGESIPGVLPYRFYEAMSAGRIPVLIGSGYVLPFQDEIDWKSFIIEVPANRAADTGDIVLDFLRSNPEDGIVSMGLCARQAWKDWLNRDDWPRTHSYLVRKKLKELRLWDGETL